MSETENTILDFFPCSECHAGILQPRHITYFTWLGNELISVPHFPAWICDVCGKREYDERAVNWLTTLLSPNAGQTTIVIYDLLGQEVAEIVNKHLQAGIHLEAFDASGLASGIYYYKIVSDGFNALKKMILMR